MEDAEKEVWILCEYLWHLEDALHQIIHLQGDVQQRSGFSWPAWLFFGQTAYSKAITSQLEGVTLDTLKRARTHYLETKNPGTTVKYTDTDLHS